MQKANIAIVTWHQTYLSSYAGGYVRLREFLQRVPKPIKYILLDNSPTIYSDIVKKESLILYKSPRWIEKLQSINFILWYLIETISTTFIIFRICSRLINESRVRVFYFPTGEFLQLYIVSLFIKFFYPNTRVILDILNYGVLDKSYKVYFKNLVKNHIGYVRSIVIMFVIAFGTSLMKLTIFHADYVFTVSKDFVHKIKKDYKKDSIGYTPSGVNPVRKLKRIKKRFLAIYVGRITTEKGVFDCISVWAEVVKYLPEAKLAIAGYADNITKLALEKEIKKRHLEKRVLLFGVVSDKEKFKLLFESNIFLHLAHFEPLFPVIGILEGLSYGLPVICYDMHVYKSSLKEYPLLKRVSFVAKSGKQKNVAELIIKYSNLSTGLKSEISKLAQESVKPFSWDEIAKKEFTVIEQLLKN